MATPTRPCPYCGAAVLATAPHCGNCGRPVQPAEQSSGGGGGGGPVPAKTIFGYQAPKQPQAQPHGQAPQAQPPQPQAPQPQAPQAQPPQAQPQQPGQAQAWGQPPQQAVPNPAASPGMPQGQPQHGSQPYPQQPGQPQQLQPQHGSQPYPQQPQPQHGSQPYPQQPQPQHGSQPYPQQPQPAQGWGGPQPGGMPGQPGGMPGQPGGALGDLAARAPQVKAGSVFGIDITQFMEPGPQKKALYILGIALVASVFIPWHLDPLLFGFSDGAPFGMFRGFLLPLIVGGAYLLVAVQPEGLREKIPPVVLQWLPFGASYVAVGYVGWGIPSAAGAFTVLTWGFPVLVFGLLNRMRDPSDPWARYIIGGGALLCLFPAIHWLTHGMFEFSHVPILMVVHNLAFGAILILAAACIAFVIPPEKVPALRGVDAFAPLATNILLVWPVVQVALLMVALIVHGGDFLSTILVFSHSLLYTVAFFGVLMITAPAAYAEIKRMAAGGPSPQPGYGQPQPGYGPQPGQPPQQQWGQPQPGYGQPPQPGQPPQQQWGQQPPQGGGYPPQGGGYPPQGGGPGGGWPQQ